MPFIFLCLTIIFLEGLDTNHLYISIFIETIKINNVSKVFVVLQFSFILSIKYKI